ncbi:MAG: GtrA family protein [Oscillospiraceae bacterium]|nr:GtrA family protein [Oscillospiraceae bacterium]
MDKNKKKMSWLIWPLAVTAVISAAGFIWLSAKPEESLGTLLEKVTDFCSRVLETYINTISEDQFGWLREQMPQMISFFGFGLLGYICWLMFKRTDINPWGAIGLTGAIVILVMVIDEMRKLLHIGGDANLFGWLPRMMGLVFALLVLVAYELALVRFPRIVNRETVSYLIIGFLTTLVDLAAFTTGAQFHIGLELNYILSWTAAFIFAFFTNKLIVFQSHGKGSAGNRREAILFFIVRLLTLVICIVLAKFMVMLLGMTDGATKIVNVFVGMVLNYCFAKWIVFKTPPEEPPEQLPVSEEEAASE